MPKSRAGSGSCTCRRGLSLRPRTRRIALGGQAARAVLRAAPTRPGTAAREALGRRLRDDPRLLFGDNNTFTRRRRPPAWRRRRPPGRAVAKPRSPARRAGTVPSSSPRNGAPLSLSRAPWARDLLRERDTAIPTRPVTHSNSMRPPPVRSKDRQRSGNLIEICSGKN